MLRNVRVTAFTVSELLRENQQGGEGVKITPLPTQIRVKLQPHKMVKHNSKRTLLADDLCECV